MNIVVNDSGNRCVTLIWFTDGQLFEKLTFVCWCYFIETLSSTKETQ